MHTLWRLLFPEKATSCHAVERTKDYEAASYVGTALLGYTASHPTKSSLHSYSSDSLKFSTAEFNLKNKYHSFYTLQVSDGLSVHHQEIKTVRLFCWLRAVSSSVWQMPVAVCTVLISWWWTDRPSETCRVFFKNKINWDIGVFCWIYYRNLLRCTVLWTSKKVLVVYVSAYKITSLALLKSHKWKYRNIVKKNILLY